MVYTVCIGNLYKIPPNEILENRKEFYRLQRGIGESIEMWLNEVQNHGNCCDFSKFVELILIDKFFCELNNDERDFIRSKHLWSLQRLNDYFLKRNFDYGQMDTNRFANLKECMPMIDDVKLEPVSDQTNIFLADLLKFRHNFVYISGRLPRILRN